MPFCQMAGQRCVLILGTSMDYSFAEPLLTCWRPPARGHGLELWHPTQLSPGDDHCHAFREALARACAAVAVLSQDFFDDPYAPGRLAAFKAVHAQRKLPLFVVIARPVDPALERSFWSDLPRTRLNDPSRPLSQLREQSRTAFERELVRMGRELLGAIRASTAGHPSLTSGVCQPAQIG